MNVWKSFIYVCCIFFPLVVFAQSNYSIKSKKAISQFEDALKAYNIKNFDEAIKMANQAIETEPNFIEAYFLLGQVSTDVADWQTALSSYKTVLKLNPNARIETWYLKGTTELQLGQYDSAVTSLNYFTTQKNKVHPKLLSKANEKLQNAIFASQAVKNPVDFNPKNAGNGVNSALPDYHPCLSLDEQELLITRKIITAKDTYGKDRSHEDFYVSKFSESGWGKAENLGPPINTPDNEGAQNLSADGRFMFFTACHRPDGFGSCDLYITKKVGNTFTLPENLGNNINSGAWDSQPCISADGKTLYFSSGRSGGKGQKDIWVSTKNADGSWQKPINLNINTPGNELSPFIHPDGKTLYFASDGYPGMGGIDIFYSKKLSHGVFTEPTNIGYPINTHKDEHGLIVNTKGKLAYFASDRDEGFGDLDIYYFELYEDARPEIVTYLVGKVYDKQTALPLEAEIELINLENEEVITTALSDEKSGRYMVALPPNKDYALNVAANGFLFHSETFYLKEAKNPDENYQLDVGLNKINIGTSVVLKNIFFETGKFELKPLSKAELKKLVAFLNLNPTMKIEIGGHTDNVGSTELNQKLSENRANAVYQYLIAHDIEPSRLSYKGYGAQKPIATNDTDEGRAKNRRTEFMVVGL